LRKELGIKARRRKTIQLSRLERNSQKKENQQKPSKEIFQEQRWGRGQTF
jgi:hypothetical protein